jgi:predicted aspartyl protease
MSRGGIFLVASAFAGACAHGPPPFHAVDLVVLRDHGQTRPLLKVKVDGEPMTLLVDTGATENFLSADFARQHSLVPLSSDVARPVRDANGKVIRMRVLPGVLVQFEGAPATVGLDFRLRESNETISGADGILAPNSLIRSGWGLVIDMGYEQLRYEEEASALQELNREGRRAAKVEYHRCPGESFLDAGHRVVAVWVNGVRADMMVDTGAAGTVLYRDNPAIPSMLARVGAKGTSTALNSRSASLRLDDVPIQFSDALVSIPVAVSPARSECAEGLLGADVLSRCVLLWGSSDLWVACRNPSKEP